MKVNTIFKYFSFKLIIASIYTCFFLYQTWLIVRQYLKYNSVINIKFTRNVINSLPAITICYDKLYSFDKLVDRYPGYEHVYGNYTMFFAKSVKRVKRSDDRKKNFTIYVEEESDYYFQKYLDIIRKLKLGRLENFNQDISLRDILDQLSMSYRNRALDENRTMHESVELIAHGEMINPEHFSTSLNKEGERLLIFNSTPIESMHLLNKIKCFTFFNSIHCPFTRENVNFNKIKITVNFPYNWFPYVSETTISIAIHSPLVVPNQDAFDDIKQATRNNIYYSKIEAIQLKDYDNCQLYDRSDGNGTFKLRRQCLSSCMQKLIKPECQNELVLMRKRILQREELPTSVGNGQCNKSSINYQDIRAKCRISCKEDCYQAYYLLEIESEPRLINNILNNKIIIDLEPNSKPNVLIEHFAEIAFLSMLCNFGGILGMYLGISLLSISCNIWTVSKKFFIKFIWINFITNNNEISPKNININVRNTNYYYPRIRNIW